MATENAISSDKPIQVELGGTGLAALADHGLLIGTNDAAITPLAAATDGQMVIGSTGADPQITALDSAGGSITFTPGAGTLNLEALGKNGVVVKDSALTAYTPILTDKGKLIRLTNTNPVIVTVPTNASVAFQTGSVIYFCAYGSGNVEFQAASGVTLKARGSSYLDANGQYAMMAIVKTGIDAWTLSGDVGKGVVPREWMQGALAQTYIPKSRDCVYGQDAAGQGYFVGCASGGVVNDGGVALESEPDLWTGGIGGTAIAWGTDDNYFVRIGNGNPGAGTADTIHSALDPKNGPWTASMLTRDPYELGKGIAYGVDATLTGVWVAATNRGSFPGDVGRAYWATDPTTAVWSGGYHPFEAATSLTTLAYGNGYWIVGAGNRLAYTQTPQVDSFVEVVDPSFGATAINRLAYGNGYWVAVGNSGKLATATTPAGPWTQQVSSFAADHIYGIRYANGVWVAVGNDHKIATATDPTFVWTQSTIQYVVDRSPLYNCCFGNGTWIALGIGYGGYDGYCIRPGE